MISKIVFVAVLATLANAWTDFHGLNPHHKSTELPDDRVHSTHDVHHVFPEHGTFFKAKYEAIHHKKWHFVELDEHDVDFMKHVNCGSSDRELFVKSPSQKLRDAVAAKNYEWTVLTAHHQYHCSETAVFRGVTGSTYHPETDTLQLHTVQLRYENVFEHLDLKLETDHFEGHVEDHSDASEEEVIAQLPEPEEEKAATTDSRTMSTQGRKWWKKLKKKAKSAVKKVVSKAKAVVKKVVDKVKQTVKKVKDIVTGTYAWNKTYNLKSFNYNKDVSKKFSKWNFNGDVRLAASAEAKPALVFNLKIEKLKLNLAEAYFRMSYKGGVRVAFSAKAAYDRSAKKQISLINLQQLSFKIITIPVVISITCPITAGYDIDVDGRVNFNFLLAASGSVKLGMRYTNTRGFQVINEKKLSKTRDFSPRYYRYQVGLQAEVLTTFRANVNFLGYVASSLQITAEATLQSNSKCIMLLQMNMQPIIVAEYQLSLTVLGKKIINTRYGPKSLVSWKVPVINYCVPKRRSTRSSMFRRGGHEMLAQNEGGSKSQTEPVNEHEVDISKPEEIADNSTGTTWFGYSDCNSNQESLTFSMQFLPGEWETDNATSTQIILTLNHNKSLSSGSNDYQMTNIQKTYAMNDTVRAGLVHSMMEHKEANVNDSFTYAVNESTNPYLVDESITISVDANDATQIQVKANTMFCGQSEFIALVAAEYSDDNSTFVSFSNGAGAPEESMIEKLKAYAIYVPILCVIVLAVVIIVLVVQRKKSQAAHGANWAKSQHDVEPIMGQEPAHVNAHYENRGAAPAPTQDSRVSAL